MAGDLVGVHRPGRGQQGRHKLDVVAGGAKHSGWRAAGQDLAHQPGQGGRALLIPHREEGGGQVGRQLGVRVQAHKLRVFQARARKLGQGGGQGGREEQGLAVGGQPGQDLAQLGRKTHLEQAVRLVEDDQLDGLQGQARHLGQHVQQAAGSGHQDVRVGRQLRKLGVQRVAAHQGGDPQVGIPPDLPDDAVGLEGELPGGGQHQAARARPQGMRLQAVDEGDGKRGGFAGPRAGHAHDVVARQDEGHRPPLDGGGQAVALALDAAHDGGGQAHRFCQMER